MTRSDALSVPSSLAGQPCTPGAVTPESSLDSLIDRYLAMIHGVCRRRLGSGADADEAAAAVLVILARQVDRVRDAASFAAWLHGVAVKTCAMSIRSRIRRRRHEAAAGELALRSRGDQQAAQDGALDAERLGMLIDQALGTLSAAQHAAIIERYFAGGSFAEVGLRLGISEDAAKKRVAAGLDRLRTHLGRTQGQWSVATLVAVLNQHHPGAISAQLGSGALRTIPIPITDGARRLAHAVLTHLLLQSLIMPVLLVLALVLAGGVTLHAYASEAAAAAAPAATPAQAPAYVKCYDVRDLVRGERWWWRGSSQASLTPAVPPAAASDPAVVALEAVRSATVMMSELRRLLGAGGQAATVSLLCPGLTDDDLLLMCGPAKRRTAQQRQQMLDNLRQISVASGNPLPDPSAGSWALVILTSAAGHQRLENLLRGARARRNDATGDVVRAWHDEIATSLQAIWTSLAATPPNLTDNPHHWWPATGVPPLLGVPTTRHPLPLHTVYLQETERGEHDAVQLLVVAGGVAGEGCFELFTDGSVMWRADEQLFAWAGDVRAAIATGGIPVPVRNDALRLIPWHAPAQVRPPAPAPTSPHEF